MISVSAKLPARVLFPIREQLEEFKRLPENGSGFETPVSPIPGSKRKAA
jgi:hypothetical protein